MIKVWVDGSCRNNGSTNARTGIAMVASREGTLLFSIGRIVKAKTNNEAEYYAVIQVLKELKPYRNEEILIQSDSSLVVNQVNGEWQIKNDEMRKLKDTVSSLVKELKFKNVRFKWVPRESNKEANKIAQKITEEK